MKKLLIFTLICIVLLTFCACQENSTTSEIEAESKTAEGIATTMPNSESIDVDSNSDAVITMPSNFFDGQSIEEITANALEEGYKQATRNEDGSVTYIIPKAKYNEMMTAARRDTEQTLSGYVDGRDTPFFKEIVYNNDYSEIHIKADRTEYENNFGSTYLLNMYFNCYFYQLVAGVSNPSTKFIVSDIGTEEVFETVIYPE